MNTIPAESSCRLLQAPSAARLQKGKAQEGNRKQNVFIFSHLN